MQTQNKWSHSNHQYAALAHALSRQPNQFRDYSTAQTALRLSPFNAIGAIPGLSLSPRLVIMVVILLAGVAWLLSSGSLSSDASKSSALSVRGETKGAITERRVMSGSDRYQEFRKQRKAKEKRLLEMHKAAGKRKGKPRGR